MPAEKLFYDLKKHFNLKDRHVLILKTLNENELTAMQICKEAEIPRGRIYSLLNELLDYGLIEKGEKKPTKYNMKNVSDKVLNYLRHSMDEFINKESEIIKQLGKIESKEKIDLIDSKRDFSFALASFFSECKASKVKQVYQIGRHQSMPFMIYPFNRNSFRKLRELVTQKRETVGHTNISYSLIVHKSYKELFDSGVKFNIIVERSALNYHMNLIKQELGAEFLNDMVKDLLGRIGSGQMNVYVLDEYLTMGADISKNDLLLSLIHLGFISAINIKSKKIAEVYTRMFESMAGRSVSLETYLKSRRLANWKKI